MEQIMIRGRSVWVSDEMAAKVRMKAGLLAKKGREISKQIYEAKIGPRGVSSATKAVSTTSPVSKEEINNVSSWQESKRAFIDKAFETFKVQEKSSSLDRMNALFINLLA